MKRIKNLLITFLMLLVLNIPNVSAQTYEECIANCENNYTNSTVLDRCKASCDGNTENNQKNNTKLHEEKVVAATKSPVEFCAKTAVIWQIVGWVILIVKIVIPILLIILGVVDFSKAAISGKDDETKKSLTSLMWRAISAVVIFFIPTLVTLVMGLVANFKDSGAQADFEVCKTCILKPSSCDTSKDAGKN